MSEFQPPDTPDAPESVGDLLCGDCVHCRPGPDTKNDVLSRCCYRMPPVPMFVNTPNGPGLASVRPAIRVDTWACGEFETDEDDGGVPG